MATEVMSAPAPVRSRAAEPTAREIISAARSASVRTRGAWLLAVLSGGLLWTGMMPLDWGPVAWFALVPLALLVRVETLPPRAYRALYGGGLVFWLPALQWMRLGHDSMYAAWFALAGYLALYFPVAAWLARAAVHRLRVPVALALPVVWVATEFLRAHLLTGFPWYFLGHTQYRWLELIQISDTTGAYGVSFLVAMSSAVLATLVPDAWCRRIGLVPPGPSLEDAPPPPGSGMIGSGASPRRMFATVGGFVLLFAAVLAYGFARRDQAPWTKPDAQPGPRVALVQGNFPTEVKHDPSEWGAILRTHDRLTGRAVPHRPDVIVWPETMFRWPLFEADAEMTDEQIGREIPAEVPDGARRNWLDSFRSRREQKRLQDDARRAGTSLIIGAETVAVDGQGTRRLNSAVFVKPEGRIAGRYDKLHRVIFGEYVPLKETLPFLQAFSPYPPGFDLAAGETAAVFDVGPWRLAPIICFEDTVPHVVRGIVKATRDPETGRSPDCLVNLTNDGWFHGSSELDQHLVTAAFRCVELRVPMVRAVNTGISAVIDGDGAIVEPEVFVDGDGGGRTTLRDPRTGRWHKSLSALLVHTVPLDGRTSLYLRWGDWFATCCLVAAGAFALAGLRRRPRPLQTSAA